MMLNPFQNVTERNTFRSLSLSLSLSILRSRKVVLLLQYYIRYLATVQNLSSSFFSSGVSINSPTVIPMSYENSPYNLMWFLTVAFCKCFVDLHRLHGQISDFLSDSILFVKQIDINYQFSYSIIIYTNTSAKYVISTYI